MESESREYTGSVSLVFDRPWTDRLTDSPEGIGFGRDGSPAMSGQADPLPDGERLRDLLQSVQWSDFVHFTADGKEHLIHVYLAIEIEDLNAYLAAGNTFPSLEPSIAEVRAIISDFGKHFEGEDNPEGQHDPRMVASQAQHNHY